MKQCKLFELYQILFFKKKSYSIHLFFLFFSFERSWKTANSPLIMILHFNLLLLLLLFLVQYLVSFRVKFFILDKFFRLIKNKTIKQRNGKR